MKTQMEKYLDGAIVLCSNKIFQTKLPARTTRIKDAFPHDFDKKDGPRTQAAT
ncbi:hypothetical protein RRSWK_04207 [Rhodopirellula sp. SWK7]|nr:hypothetical protein RRSWK_04207 [Rhodopirellula sp. SWK7]